MFKVKRQGKYFVKEDISLTEIKISDINMKLKYIEKES